MHKFKEARTFLATIFREKNSSLSCNIWFILYPFRAAFVLLQFYWNAFILFLHTWFLRPRLAISCQDVESSIVDASKTTRISIWTLQHIYNIYKRLLFLELLQSCTIFAPKSFLKNQTHARLRVALSVSCVWWTQLRNPSGKMDPWKFTLGGGEFLFFFSKRVSKVMEIVFELTIIDV